MENLKNVVYAQELTKEGFIVQFNIWGKYLSTNMYNFYEGVYISTDTFWSATIFPLDWEEKVKDRLEKDKNWKTFGAYRFLYLTYKQREEIVFSDKNETQ